MPHYRIPFYNNLAVSLAESNIELRLVYGQEYPGTVPKTVMVDEPWASFCPSKYFHCCGLELVWQEIPRKYMDTDLLIVEQANRLLNNYPILFFRRQGRKLAFWGHGKNMQSEGNNIKEIIKKKLARKVDWWFAYTDISKQEVIKSGFPPNCITVVNNSIDTGELQKNLVSVTQQQIDDILTSYKITAPDFVCLYCGGLYPDKKLDFLISTCEKVQRSLPDFSLFVVGNGPEEKKMQAASVRFDWLHYVGAKFGAELVPFFKIAQLLLMPGLVGLVFLDSFIAGVPLLTTDNKIHSPEIAYLQNGINGIMTAYDEDMYASEVVKLLLDKSKLEKLRKGCLESARIYTLDNMVENFTAGIQQCLSIE